MTVKLDLAENSDLVKIAFPHVSLSDMGAHAELSTPAEAFPKNSFNGKPQASANDEERLSPAA